MANKVKHGARSGVAAGSQGHGGRDGHHGPEGHDGHEGSLGGGSKRDGGNVGGKSGGIGGGSGGSGGSGGDKPKAFTIKYKRPRGSRACVVCRSRKVRCDAEIHIPCTNCITFGCECTLPEAKKRGNVAGEGKSKRAKTSMAAAAAAAAIGDKEMTAALGPGMVKSEGSGSSWPTMGSGAHKGSVGEGHSGSGVGVGGGSSSSGGGGGSNEPVLNISQVSVPPSLTSNYKTRPSIHKNEMGVSGNRARASITFLGSSSIGLVAQKVGQNHLQLSDDLFDLNEDSLDSIELEILKLRGAFLLPSNELALDLVNTYFEHVHPLMPVINRTEFMRKFNDPNDNPSLMLLQAVLLCGSRISSNPLLLDSKGSNNLAALTFFRRAKALYETNYESDPISIIQSLILIGSYGEGPEDVTKNSFYWTRVAVGLAQGFGFQRDVSNSPNLTESEKKIWRRIWWVLFEKDRNVAIAYGRPAVIDLNDCDVPMLTINDFNEDELDQPSPYPLDETQALYFIHLVKLAEITGIIIKHQYTVKAELMKRKNKFSVIQHCDMLMGIWFSNLPPQLVFSLNDPSTQNFYSCLLNAQYYNRLYLIHRSNLIRMAKSNSTDPSNYKYPSWGISFQAARMISIVSKILMEKDLIRYCPVMFVYILFSALIMLIYHVDSLNQIIATTASDSLFVVRAVLGKLADFWPIANVLVKLFDKHADDKIKRAKVIENGTRIAEFQELSATQNALNTEQNINNYYGNSTNNSNNAGNNLVPKNNSLNLGYVHENGTRPSPSHLITSAVSPGGNIYLNNIDYEQENAACQQQPAAQPQPTTMKPPEPNIEELVQQYKHPKRDGQNGDDNAVKASSSPTNRKANGNSPTSSTQSFTDISLVTENMPINLNFYENFEPTQLFPDAKLSLPPTRAQSPYNGNGVEDINGSDMQGQQGNEENISSTQQYSIGVGVLNPNFVDSSYINMNLQSTAENNFLNDDLGSLFNFQL